MPLGGAGGSSRVPGGSLGRVCPTWGDSSRTQSPPSDSCHPPGSVPNVLGPLGKHQGLEGAARGHLEIWGPTLGSREVTSPGPHLVYRVSKGLRGGEKDPKSPRGPPGPRPGGDSRSLSPPAACGRCDPPHLCQATMEPCPGQPQEALLTVNEQVRPPCPPKPGRGWDPSLCPGRG